MADSGTLMVSFCLGVRQVRVLMTLSMMMLETMIISHKFATMGELLLMVILTSCQEALVVEVWLVHFGLLMASFLIVRRSLLKGESVMGLDMSVMSLDMSIFM